jgi:hypothetical protein
MLQRTTDAAGRRQECFDLGGWMYNVGRRETETEILAWNTLFRAVNQLYRTPNQNG